MSTASGVSYLRAAQKRFESESGSDHLFIVNAPMSFDLQTTGCETYCVLISVSFVRRGTKFDEEVSQLVILFFFFFSSPAVNAKTLCEMATQGELLKIIHPHHHKAPIAIQFQTLAPARKSCFERISLWVLLSCLFTLCARAFHRCSHRLFLLDAVK